MVRMQHRQVLHGARCQGSVPRRAQEWGKRREGGRSQELGHHREGMDGHQDHWLGTRRLRGVPICLIYGQPHHLHLPCNGVNRMEQSAIAVVPHACLEQSAIAVVPHACLWRLNLISNIEHLRCDAFVPANL